MGMGRCCGDGRSYWRADDGGKRFGERSGIGPEPDLGGDQRIRGRDGAGGAGLDDPRPKRNCPTERSCPGDRSWWGT